MPSTVDDVRLQFLELLFGDEDGYLCIASHHKTKPKSELKRSYFSWPVQKSEALAFIAQKSIAHDVWFATCLFDRSRALKEYAQPTRVVPADLDECDPETVTPNPPIVIQTSPGRWQALWLLDDYVDPVIAEGYAKRIAYKYSMNGADKSGWDIGQLLRVPYTTNFKKGYGQPEVELLRVLDMPVPVSIFEELPPPQDELATPEQTPIPDELPNCDETIKQHWAKIEDPAAFTMLHNETPEPDDDWSKRMWRLIHMCFEAGMTSVETFAVVREAGCNKYLRDDRPERYLWYEVQKAGMKHQRLSIAVGKIEAFEMPVIIDPEADQQFTFIDMYREYGMEATDAPTQFHDLTAMMIMAACMAANIKVQANYGLIRPHLWGMMLGESTLTRKTTAMRLGMDIITGIDDNILLATEGSIEGILQALALRQGKASVFFRDEVGGMFTQMERMNYMAGSREVFTNLYDAPKFYKRKLRKETVTVSDPIFMMFNGGVREQVYTILSDDAITSGFLPRYLIMSGDNDPNRIRPTGPPKEVSASKHDEVVQHANHMFNEYTRNSQVKVAGSADAAIETPLVVEAVLDEDAWEEFQRIESILTQSAYNSHVQMLALPMFGRLATSVLKIGLLIAASRQEPTQANEIRVEKRDIVSAARYGQEFGKHAVDAVLNIGKPMNERNMVRVLRGIQRHPGIPRADLMRQQHLMKREADDILNTLLERGEIYAEKVARATHYTAYEET